MNNFGDILYWYERISIKIIIILYTLHFGKRSIFNLKYLRKCYISLKYLFKYPWVVLWIYHIIIYIKAYIDYHYINIMRFALILQVKTIMILNISELIQLNNCFQWSIMLQCLLNGIYTIIVGIRYILPNLETSMLTKLCFKLIFINWFNC